MATDVNQTTITEHEAGQIERANASGLTPAMFVHGLWLLPNSWDPWRALFEEARLCHDYAPAGPTTPTRSHEAREDPEVFAGKKSLKVTSRPTTPRPSVRYQTQKPAIVGHSFGGQVIAEELAGQGLSAATVAIDPAPFRGVLPLPYLGAEVGRAGARQPRELRPRAVSLTLRAVQLRVEQRRLPQGSQRALRDVPRAGCRPPAVLGGVCQRGTAHRDRKSTR